MLLSTTMRIALFVAVLLHAVAAKAATEYLYQLDGVQDLPVHVEGSIAVLDMPSIAVGPRRLGEVMPFRPERIVYDAATTRIVMMDVPRKKMMAMTRAEMLATKQQFLQRYADSKRAEFAKLPADERAANERKLKDALAHPSAVTTFGPSIEKRLSTVAGNCDEVAYRNDGITSGIACVVPMSALAKAVAKEAEAVFGALAATELFQIQIDTSVAPGLVAALATPRGPNGHSVRLVRVREVANDKRLYDTTGFTAAVLPPH